METYLTKSYTAKGHRKCHIIERSKKDDSKIRTIDTIEGFCVSFSYTVYTRTFLDDIGWLLPKESEKEIFNRYCENYRLSKIIPQSELESNVSIYKTEIDNLVKFKKHIDLFIEDDKQEDFIKICNSFSDWLRPQIDKIFSLEIILKKMFPHASKYELDLLQNNLNGIKPAYLSLSFVGTKESLWFNLGEVYSFGIKRSEMLRVFSECVSWKKNNVAEAKPLKYDEINRKLQGKGVKKG